MARWNRPRWPHLLTHRRPGRLFTVRSNQFSWPDSGATFGPETSSHYCAIGSHATSLPAHQPPSGQAVLRGGCGAIFVGAYPALTVAPGGPAGLGGAYCTVPRRCSRRIVADLSIWSGPPPAQPGRCPRLHTARQRRSASSRMVAAKPTDWGCGAAGGAPRRYGSLQPGARRWGCAGTVLQGGLEEGDAGACLQQVFRVAGHAGRRGGGAVGAVWVCASL
jgi:hypothetical protein